MSSAGIPMAHHGSSSANVGANAGNGNQEKIPTVMIERPKMPRATWEALRNHILRERQRKRQEQQQTQEVERMKKEREHKKKQEALTIEETKAEISNAEAKLAQLKEEKHQLFNTLKRVIHEDERRHPKVPTTMAPQMYLQTAMRQNPNSQYMKPAHLLMTGGGPASSKRPRSPSPPRTNSAYYRAPQVSKSSKYTSYPGSAVASVSASTLYAHSTSASSHPYTTTTVTSVASDDRSKPVYLSQPLSALVTASRTSYTNSLAVAERERAVQAQQRAALAAAAVSGPPTAHGTGASYRGGSILGGYPRTVAYTVGGPASVTTSATSPSARQVSSHAPLNGSFRYYSQRD